MTLAAPRTLAVARRVDVRIELLPGSRPLRHGARVRVHQGTADSMARVSLSAIRAPSNPESPLGFSHHERGPWRRVELGRLTWKCRPAARRSRGCGSQPRLC